MFRNMRQRAAMVAAVASLGLMAVAANAATVSFHTVGTFNTTAGTVGVASASGNVIQINGSDSITFAGVGTAATPYVQTLFEEGWPAVTKFGEFDFNISSTNFFSNVGFKLDIYQDAANGDSGAGSTTPATFVGSVNGFVSYSADGLFVGFDAPLTQMLPIGGPVVFPPTVIYTVPQLQVIGLGATNDLRGLVQAAPLPAVAPVGLTLLGVLGGAGAVKRLRRGREVVSA